MINIKIFSEALILILTGIILYFILFIPAAFIGMWLWNAIIPILFVSAPLISFWQMYGLLWLLRIMIPYSTTSK